MIATRALGRSALRPTTLGFGGGPAGHLQGVGADQQVETAAAIAWQGGIRYFDTAPLYGRGNSERRLGRFLRTMPRDDFVVSTKVGRYFKETADGPQLVYDYSRAGALIAIEQSLERLGLDRIDIALIHDIDRWTHGEAQPARFGEALDGAYHALADLRAEGVVGAIGIGVNEWQVCDAFARRAPIDCVLLAGRHTLIEHAAAEFFLPFCVEEGIGVIVGGPFNSGILATGPVDGATYNYGLAPPLLAARVGEIEAVCAEHGVPLGAAALAYPLLSEAVVTVIPGLASAAEVTEVVAWAAHPIPPALWDALREQGLIPG